MPQQLLAQLTAEQASNLLAYLYSLREPNAAVSIPEP